MGDLTKRTAVDKIRLMSVAESHDERVTRLQRTLQTMADVDGWLFYDFRHSDPLAYRILLLDPERHVTRRWYYWVPAKGDPVKLVHRIEPRALDPLPGEVRQYVSWESLQQELRRLLTGAHLVAMQYSPMNAIPYVSRVDAGTIDLIRSFGVRVITSADLVQNFEAVWTEEQLVSHQVAAEILRRVVDETFRDVAEALTAGRPLTERTLQQFMLGRFQVHGVMTATPPIVAVNAHSADPHYAPTPERSSPIEQGDLVLIDLWAKQPHHPAAVYADITWTGFVGKTVPARQEEVFQAVRQARDAAVDFVRERAQSGNLPCGWEVDDVCRGVIREAGYGDQFVHRTGHSIGEEVHGNGANIDNLETQDGRRLLPHTCFSIEPGIYLTGEFGIRSELDVYVAERDAVVFGQPVQTAIVPMLDL
ncbi:peptidase M24 [Nitrospira sp.]|nr:peptidase M24 [Nitrospira sp.]